MSGTLFTLNSSLLNDEHPFGHAWLDSCYQETCLPNATWNNKIHGKLCDGLAKKVAKQFEHAERKQMLFELLGREFVGHYFPDEPFNPVILADISEQHYEKLKIDAQNWLRNVVNMVAADIKCQRPQVAQEKKQAQSPVMEEFLQQCHNSVVRGMDRQLFLQEREIVNAWEVAEYDEKNGSAKTEDDDVVNKAAKEYIKKLQEQHHFRGYSESGVRSILKNAVLPPSRASTALSAASAPFLDVKDAVFGNSDDPPLFWGLQSNTLGRSVLAVLRRDPRRFEDVAAKLHGHQLPGSLRTYIWVDVLLKKEREKMNNTHLEKIVRERFGKAVARGVADLDIRRATHSPISGLIDNAVIEVFEATPGMRMFVADDAVMKESAKALNVLYTYDKSYEPYLIYWLFPLQLAFRKDTGEGEHVYELAMFLDLLNRHCFPRWPEVFAMAESVMSRLQEQDSEFYDHIRYIAQVDPHVNPKDFLVHLIHREKAKAEALLNQNPQPNFNQKSDVSLLADPLIFIRKWIGEGFVSVLDTQAAVYVWDQCFMQLWRRNVLENVALSLMLLLRERFMDCSNYSEMKKVFMGDPCKLYTMDIRNAWKHLEASGPMNRVPRMNRQRPRGSDSPIEEPLPPTLPHSPSLTEESKAPLCPLGVKNLSLKIKFPSHVLESEQWLHEFDSSLVRVRFDVYFGSVRLMSRVTCTAGVSRSKSSTKYGAQSYTIQFPGEKIVFEELDPSGLDLEQEMGGCPYAVANVEYITTEDGIKVPVTLGWVRLKLYLHQSEAKPLDERKIYGRSQWVLSEGPQSLVLHAGSVQDRSIQAQGPATPAQEATGLIGPKSSLDLVLYDLRAEPATPLPGSLRSQHPSRAQSIPAQLSHQSPSPVAKKTPTPAPESEPDVLQSFDFYIDQVANLPDAASICKVTGRILKIGKLEPMPDLLSLPELTSDCRHPKFTFKLTLDARKEMRDERMVVLLRVYTVDSLSQELVVVGSCFFEFYNQETQELKLGSHARVLHHGMPDLTKGLGTIVHNCLDDGTRIPGCCFRFRLEKSSQDHKPMPNEEDYVLDDPEWTSLEKKIIQVYAEDKDGMNVQEKAQRLMEKEGHTAAEGADLTEWIKQRLDITVQLPENTAAADFNLDHVVHYREKYGLKATLLKAHAMPEEVWVQCFGRLLPANEEKITPIRQNMGSFQKVPEWTEPPTSLHPPMSSHASLLLEFHGLPISYSAADQTICHKKKGMPVVANKNTFIGWAVVPMLNKEFIPSKTYQVPMFKSYPPDPALLNLVEEKGVQAMISSRKWTKKEKQETASIVVSIWNGIFEEKADLMTLTSLQKDMGLLEVSGDPLDTYTQAETEQKGRRVGHVLLAALDKKVQSKGVINNPGFDEAVEPFYAALETCIQSLDIA